jgi:GNAT superfamily N-acetyltransferase
VDAADIVIRLLQPEEHASWLPLWQRYQSFYRVSVAPEVSECTWARLIAGVEPVSGALAWRLDTAVGLVHYVQHRSTWTIGNYCYLHDLYVAPEYRGKGIGRQLIEHVYAAAREAGCTRVYWLTHETNAEARRLYDKVAERSGFIQYRKTLQ